MIISKIEHKKGTYVLILETTQDEPLTIGHLGTFLMPEGFYLYAGSALGPGGLKARIHHHLRINIRLHWHIDHLRKIAIPVEVWYTEMDRRLEHNWATVFTKIGSFVPFIRGFGASDCNCETHLFHSKLRPSLMDFEKHTSDKIWRVTFFGLPSQ